MQVTHPDMLGDLGDQIPAAKFGLGICRPVDDHLARLARKAAAIDLPESEHLSPADLMEEMMKFAPDSPGGEGRLNDELGPGRFSRLMKLFWPK